ncbi:MAG: tetratricopeptide repeat protein [Calditrichaeota bacterium]|nr:tetratricopeptide repeat protein [Calditrichota bacterium]
MGNIKGQKTIKAVIPLSLINDNDRQLLKAPLNAENKKHLLQKFFQIDDSQANAIKVEPNENTLNLLWHIPKVSPDAEQHHKQAIIAAKNRKLDESILHWEEASNSDPYNPEYLFHLGIAYYETKKYNEAIQSLKRAITICPILQKAYIILGMSYLKIRKFDESKNYLEKSLIFNRKNLLIYLNLGSVYGILKDYNRAEEMFMQAINISPKEPRPYFGLAKIYATLGKNDEANNFFKKVIELDKKGILANYAKRSIVILQPAPEATAEKELAVESAENPEEYYTRGYRFFLLGNFGQAIRMYQQYLRIKPSDDYVWYALGEAQLRAGDVKNAVESFKRAAKISPKKGLYYKEMAVGFYYLHDWEKLAAATKKAKELGKNDSLVYCLLGKALKELGNINESIVMLDHSLKTNSNNLLAKYFIAQSLLKKNDPENALGYLEEITSSKINSQVKSEAEKLLKEIEAM